MQVSPCGIVRPIKNFKKAFAIFKARLKDVLMLWANSNETPKETLKWF